MSHGPPPPPSGSPAPFPPPPGVQSPPMPSAPPPPPRAAALPMTASHHPMSQAQAEQPVFGAPGRRAVGRPTALEGSKSYIGTLLLSYFLGMFGVDRLYLGKRRSAVAKLVTLGGFGYWWLFDFVVTLSGRQTDEWGLRLRGAAACRRPALIVLGTSLAILFGIALLSALWVAATR